MDKILETAANGAACAGVMVCFIAGLIRIMGHYSLSGFEMLTLYNVGIGLMVFAVLLKLEAILKAIKNS